MKQLKVYRGRTNIVPVSLGFDVSQDSFASDIRVSQNPTSRLIASWDISFATDGKDGELVFKLDSVLTSLIKENHGYMDLKRVSGQDVLNVFEAPIQVIFLNTITT